ncbi:hypothetical protein KR222_003178, partial [Zaprionus bogoriensis]
LSFSAESISDYNDLLQRQAEEEKWARYMECDKMPRVTHPSDLRTFIAEIEHFEDQDVHKVVDWSLSVDERSLLTQDIDRVDLTRKLLEQTLRPDIGKLYDVAIQRILIVLDRIEVMMASDLQMAYIPKERAVEIFAMRGELTEEIDVLFDKLTYRIICGPSSYKTSDSGVMESYCYSSCKFKIQIWWLIDVAMRFKYLELPLILVDLDCLSVQVQIPMSVLVDNMTVRGVHTFFDPYSEFAKSYDYVMETPLQDFNAGMMDIEDCLANEWSMQVAIIEKQTTLLEQRFLIYEATMKCEFLSALSCELSNNLKIYQLYREYEAKMTQAAVSEKKRAPKFKSLKEPQRLPEGKLPDPYRMFIEQEQREFKEFLDNYLSPEQLKLAPDEVSVQENPLSIALSLKQPNCQINLRQYRILGGIFSLHFVKKPKHTEFQKFNITLHEDGRVLYTMFDVQPNLDDEEYINPSGLQLMQASRDIKDLNLHLEPYELPYFFITFQLPENLCRFGEPLACQFLDEEVEEDDPDTFFTVEVEDSRPIKKKRKKESASLTKKVAERGSDKKKDEKKEYGRPTLMPGLDRKLFRQNLYRPSITAMYRTSLMRPSLLPGAVVHDFQLIDVPITSLQSQELQRHCLPRLLSSFKFPNEFRTEKSDEQAEKKRGNLFLRRHQVKDEDTDEEPELEYFNYEKQEAPERLYPKFGWRQRLIYEQTEDPSKDLEKSSSTEIVEPGKDEDTTFHSMLHKLQDIQEKYTNRPNRLLFQSNFNPKIRTSTIDTFDSTLRESSVSHKKEKGSVRIVSTKSLSSPKQSQQRGSYGKIRGMSIADTASFDSSPSQRSQSSVSLSGLGGRFTKKTISHYEATDEPPVSKRKIRVKHWTTKHILKTDFDRQKLSVTLKTNRLGLFGFAYKSYAHFPFSNWHLQQNEENPNEIIFTLDTFYVRIILFITNAGIRGYVTKITNEYSARPVKYMEITEPISDYRELRRRFCENNFNIFAENDACFYIENGYFSEKHLATELHVYDAFAIHCKLVRFYRSDWNRLAQRRSILLCLRNPKDLNEGADVTVNVTPDNSTFVEMSELCSDDLDVIKLNYQLTWRNIGVYSDLHQLINSMYPQATDVRNRDPKLIYYIRKLFTEVRPLSFS